MKRILIALTMGMLFCSMAFAQKKITTYKDSIGHVKITVSKTESKKDSAYIPEYTDTSEDGITVESESTDIYDDTPDSDYSVFSGEDLSVLKDLSSAAGAGIALAFFILILIFGFPIFVIFIAFYFRYKSRRERYKLVEKAIAAGQPIPEGILRESLNTDTRTKGIKNMCLGAGLFIFLWAITNSFAIGCIGLLILFTGLGQWLVARNQHPTDEQR
ncbi:DUF6249 domain-containing protein [Bacteroides sp.]